MRNGIGLLKIAELKARQKTLQFMIGLINEPDQARNLENDNDKQQDQQHAAGIVDYAESQQQQADEHTDHPQCELNPELS